MSCLKRSLGIISCLIVAMGLSHFAVAADEPLEFAVLKEAYAKKLETLAADTAKRAVDPLIEKYDEALDRFETEEAEAGRLETVLMVREERTRVAKEKGIKEEQIIKEVPAMAEVQMKLLRKMEEIELAEKPQREAAAEIYIKKLKELKIKFTKQKKIEAAVLVSADLERVSKAGATVVGEAAESIQDDRDYRSELEGSWEVVRYDGYSFGLVAIKMAGRGKIEIVGDNKFLREVVGVYTVEGRNMRREVREGKTPSDILWEPDRKGFKASKDGLYGNYLLSKPKKGNSKEEE